MTSFLNLVEKLPQPNQQEQNHLSTWRTNWRGRSFANRFLNMKNFLRLPLIGIAACTLGGVTARGELLVSSFSSNRVLRYSETDGSFTDVFIANANGALSLPQRSGSFSG